MKMLAAIGIIAGAYFVGAIGFPQIVGSIQNIKTLRYGLFTIFIWTLILLGIGFVVFRFLPAYRVSLVIGYAASLIMTLAAGKIS